jgi:hypothetical protein
MRQEAVAFDVLDATLAVIGTLNPARDPVPRITNDTSRTIKRALSGLRVPATEAAAVDPFRDRIRARWVIEDDPAVYPLGVFLFADQNQIVRSYGTDLDLELVDQTFIIDQPLLEGVSYGIGTPVGATLALLAADAGVPSFYVAPSSVTLQRPATWPGGTSLYRVLADLCLLEGFTPPFFDNEGTLRLVDAPDPELAPATRLYPPGSPIIDPSIVRTDDLLTAPNRWVVVDNGATAGPVVGVYELPSTAPHSFFNRGFHVTQWVEQQGLESVAAAVAAAKALALTDPDGVERASFSTVVDPRHDTYDVVEFAGARWLEESWSMDLRAGGAQSHQLRALYAA